MWFVDERRVRAEPGSDRRRRGAVHDRRGKNEGAHRSRLERSRLGWRASYEWDLDNDGEFDDSTSQTPTFPAMGDNGGPFTVGVKVTDSFGSSDTDSTTVTVNNVKPSVTSLSDTDPKDEKTRSRSAASSPIRAGSMRSLP